MNIARYFVFNILLCSFTIYDIAFEVFFASNKKSVNLDPSILSNNIPRFFHRWLSYEL